MTNEQKVDVIWRVAGHFTNSIERTGHSYYSGDGKDVVDFADDLMMDLEIKLTQWLHAYAEEKVKHVNEGRI